MRRSIFSLIAVLVAGTSAYGLDLTGDSQKILGKYDGKMEVYTVRIVKDYKYSVTIYKIDAEKNELSLKIQCDDCEKKEYTMPRCKITSVTPDLEFGCKGETWHVNYQLTGDLLKGNGISATGPPFSVKVKKIQENEK